MSRSKPSIELAGSWAHLSGLARVVQAHEVS